MSSDIDESASTDVASTDVEMDTVLQSPRANILSEPGEASGQASPKQHVGENWCKTEVKNGVLATTLLFGTVRKSKHQT